MTVKLLTVSLFDRPYIYYLLLSTCRNKQCLHLASFPRYHQLLIVRDWHWHRTAFQVG